MVLWLILDRITKIVCEGALGRGDHQVLIDGVLELRLVHNQGAAWGSFSGMLAVLIVVTSILCVVIGVFAWRTASHAPAVEMFGLALIFAGGIGNLIDRVMQGYVVDFINVLFIEFPTFNIADIGITCGIAIVVICFAIQLVKERKQNNPLRVQ